MTTKIKFNGAPGAGKSYQLIKLLNDSLKNGTPGNEIIACTFRRASADDLKLKIDNDGENMPYVGTIHSICYKLLGRHDMITDQEITVFCKTNGLRPPKTGSFNWQNTDQPSKQPDFFNLYGWMKNTLTDIDDISSYPMLRQLKLPTDIIKTLIIKYEDYKTEIDKIDFTDQISMVIDQELTPPDTHMMFVDEFQDLTAAQYKVFEIWADNMDLVAIAGDPNQTIYPFWGASSKFFTEYGGKEHVLGITHRVPIIVWNTAKRILQNNGLEIPNVVSDRQGELHYINYRQAQQQIKDHPTDTMHLVRSNYLGVAISYSLADAGIIYTGINSWSDNEINMLNGIIAVRNRGVLLKNEMLEILNKYPDRFFILESTKKDLIETITENTKTMYNKADYSVLFNRNPTLFENDTLYGVIESADPTTHMIGATKLFKNKLLNAISKNTKRVVIDEHTVKIQTIHGAKGGEADTVFLHTGITPKIKKAMRTPHGRIDEAKIFFVGLTRTAKTCFVVKDKGSSNYNIPAVVS